MSDPGNEKLSEIVGKCLKDEAFKERFKASPAEVLTEHGLSVPEGVKIHVVENTDEEVYFTLPPAPGSVAELSDADLEAVAGGGLRIRPSAFRYLVYKNTIDQNLSTCGKDCIPW